MNVRKITVGLPVYNGGETLAETIKSVLAQTFRQFELLISDNASTDNTHEICSFYAHKDERVRHIRHSINIGPVNNFNYLVENSDGEYFIWVASDDTWQPEFLRTLYEALSARPSAGLAFCDIGIIDHDGRSISSIELSQLRGKGHFSTVFSYIYMEPFHGPCNLVYGLFRRELIKKAINLDYWRNSNYGADYGLVLFVILQSELIVNNQKLFNNRIGGISGQQDVSEHSLLVKARNVHQLYAMTRNLILKYFNGNSVHKLILVLISFLSEARPFAVKILPFVRNKNVAAIINARRKALVRR
jgi:glycosyltransferase involved in cell wall biosynthesis